MLTYHVQPLTLGQHTPSCLIPLHNKGRTHKKKASCGTSPRGVAHEIRLPQNVHKFMKSRPALSLLVMLAWLYVTRLTRPNKIFYPLTTPCHAYHHAHHTFRHTKPNNQGNTNTDNKHKWMEHKYRHVMRKWTRWHDEYILLNSH